MYTHKGCTKCYTYLEIIFCLRLKNFSMLSRRKDQLGLTDTDTNSY